MALPRLLSKREIDVKKAQERQRELDEGGKLARTIDALRKTRVDEEQSFELWRVTTLRQIQEEINAKILERDALDEQIKNKKQSLWEHSLGE